MVAALALSSSYLVSRVSSPYLVRRAARAAAFAVLAACLVSTGCGLESDAAFALSSPYLVSRILGTELVAAFAVSSPCSVSTLLVLE